MKSLLFASAIVLCALSGGVTVQAKPKHYHVIQKGHHQVEVVPVPERHSVLDALKSDAFHPAAGSDVIAAGSFDPTLLETGWNVLKIVTSGNHTDYNQAYAAGYFEGHLTNQQANDHYTNYFTSAPPVTEAIDNYFDQHIEWLKNEIANNNGTSSYWYHVGLQWAQWEGLRDGLNSVAPANAQWSINKLMALTSMGDLFDLNGFFNVSSKKQKGTGLQATDAKKGTKHWSDMTKDEFELWFATNTHCSSLFKVKDDLSDIFFGHAAWFYFRTTMRIFKHITLNYNDEATYSKTISMSSYPGMLSSFDDYYLTDKGIVAIETSLGVLNYTMYVNNIYPQSLLYWQRVMVANRLATSAPHWAELIAYKNSGTYNNQWMILDLQKFTPGQPLVKDTMWVAEQMPGVVASRDVTEFLRYGYYPSYNVPMNQELYWQSGYAAAAAKSPQMNSYQMCVRAQIFRRDQATVTDLKSFQHIMQYNDFEVDPISQGNPLYAIASRVDLSVTEPSCFGAIDAKTSSYKLWKQGQIVYARSGPTPQQPTFAFNTTAAKSQCSPHNGLPEVFDFPYQMMSP